MFDDATKDAIRQMLTSIHLNQNSLSEFQRILGSRCAIKNAYVDEHAYVFNNRTLHTDPTDEQLDAFVLELQNRKSDCESRLMRSYEYLAQYMEKITGW